MLDYALAHCIGAHYHAFRQLQFDRDVSRFVFAQIGFERYAIFPSFGIGDSIGLDRTNPFNDRHHDRVRVACIVQDQHVKHVSILKRWRARAGSHQRALVDEYAQRIGCRLQGRQYGSVATSAARKLAGLFIAVGVLTFDDHVDLCRARGPGSTGSRERLGQFTIRARRHRRHRARPHARAFVPHNRRRR